MTEIWLLIIALFIAGLFAGVLAGLFGVGGGLILVPIFVASFQWLGFDNPQLMQIAVATSLATIIVTSMRSLHAHNKKGAVDWEILKNWFLPIALGAILAVLVARDLRSEVMMIIFALFGACIAFVLFFGIGRKVISEQMPTGIKQWIYGGMIGFLSTMMGIGGGSMAVPIMVMHGRSMHQAVATAAGFGAMIAIPSVMAFMISAPPAENLPPFQIGYVNMAAFLIVILATMISTPLGAKMAHNLDAQKLRRYFAIFIFVVALNMLRKALYS